MSEPICELTHIHNHGPILVKRVGRPDFWST